MLLTTAAVSACPIGKYDTYKGSTPGLANCDSCKSQFLGKYDTYKGSTHDSNCCHP